MKYVILSNKETNQSANKSSTISRVLAHRRCVCISLKPSSISLQCVNSVRVLNYGRRSLKCKQILPHQELNDCGGMCSYRQSFSPSLTEHSFNENKKIKENKVRNISPLAKKTTPGVKVSKVIYYL